MLHSAGYRADLTALVVFQQH